MRASTHTVKIIKIHSNTLPPSLPIMSVTEIVIFLTIALHNLVYINDTTMKIVNILQNKRLDKKQTVVYNISLL